MKKDKTQFPNFLSAPAQRALLHNGITELQQLAAYSTAELLKWHGLGKSSIPLLEKALESVGLSFKKEVAVLNTSPTVFVQTYFHGTKAYLKPGDLIEAGNRSNYGKNNAAPYVFFSATLDAAVWGAELAAGDGKPRIYVVEPTGKKENDPDLTDRKFKGNPTQSFRSKQPLRVLGEVVHFTGHPEDQVLKMRAHLQHLENQGISSLNEHNEG